jgi:uncharacterized protein YlxP (DUF503 family)
MIVGTLQARLYVRESRSLKDKRQVVRSVLDRLRHAYNVSITEVDAQDDHKLVVLGAALVGDDAQKIRRTLDEIANHLRRHPIAQFLDCTVEV